jgi:maltooligosyltrehalose trehalohydrolase
MRLCAGHEYKKGSCSFTCWAPKAKRLDLVLPGPKEARLPMEHHGQGVWHAAVEDVVPGLRYAYSLDHGPLRPDPTSHLQPDGVHGPSAVVDHTAFRWNDAAFRPPALAEWVIYELHVGTFSPEGTFAGAIAKLPLLAELGVTVLEVMPVATFPGARNWGYDGVAPYAVHAAYGGPEGFKCFVDAAHGLGMAVILDVVYNHLGPEGNYLREFGPYFTAEHHTPWGEAVNYDGPNSGPVRDFVVANALHWIRRYHVDGLRLDAVQTIHDESVRHILSELSLAVKDEAERLGRPLRLIAESDRNDPRLVRPLAVGGLGCHGVWSDDLHHALHALTTREKRGYYTDYGRAEHVALALEHGFAYRGEHSRFRRAAHGQPPDGVPCEAHVVALQNHDQVGNRMRGERISHLTNIEAVKTAAACVLLSPFTPLLFMGEEWAAAEPFSYFTSHGDPGLIKAVRAGRRKEFKSFGWKGEPPDPQDEATFAACTLDWQAREKAPHAGVLACYRALLALRREEPFATRTRVSVSARALLSGGKEQGAVVMNRTGGGREAVCLFLFAPKTSLDFSALLPAGNFSLVLDTGDDAFGGPGRAFAAPPARRARIPGPRALVLVRETHLEGL